MIGTTVGSYQITERLAEGGMGEVFIAKHAVMGRDAVVKLLKPELSHNEEMVRRFFNEARAAASINDPGIVQVFDVGYTNDHRGYIAMERLRGETLAHRLRTRGMPIEQAVHVLRLLARTLDAAHAHGIVHRDLKPDNIFLVPDRDVPGGERTKILDFGIAKLAGAGSTQHATRSGSIFGTPAYMAPEQCSDAATVDARADLYALGCIAYEMLSGKPPFGFGGLELLASHLRDEPVPLRQRNPSVPAWLEEVVHRLLRKSPSERHASSADLHGALDPRGSAAMLAQVPSTVPPTMPPTQASLSAVTPSPMFPRTSPTPIPGSSIGTEAPPQPSGMAPNVAPVLTTHATASGMVTTSPPPARSKLPLIIGGLAVVAAAVVVIVVLGSRPKEPDPVAAPVARPKQVGNPLADAFEAARAERWEDAMAHASKVPADSPDHARASEITARAKSELPNRAALETATTELGAGDTTAARNAASKIADASVYHARALAIIAKADAAKLALAQVKPPRDPKKDPRKDPKKDPKRDPKLDPKLIVDVGSAAPPPPPPEPETPKLGYEDAMSKARHDLGAKQYGAALRNAKAALASKPGDGDALMHATIAACGLGNKVVALGYLPKNRSAYRENSLSRCSNLRVDLE